MTNSVVTKVLANRFRSGFKQLFPDIRPPVIAKSRCVKKEDRVILKDKDGVYRGVFFPKTDVLYWAVPKEVENDY